MAGMTREARADLKRKLDQIAAALKPLEEARRQAIADIQPKIDTLEEQREALLEEAGAEIEGNCEACGLPVFLGERAHRYTDCEIVECEDCAPTYREELASVNGPQDFAEPEDYEAFVALCTAKIADGKGDEKHVWEI